MVFCKNFPFKINHIFLELSEYEKNVTRQIHKSKAYKKAAGSVANHPTKITTVQEAKKLGGVGKKIAEKIEQYLKSGMINKVDKVSNLLLKLILL